MYIYIYTHLNIPNIYQQKQCLPSGYLNFLYTNSFTVLFCKVSKSRPAAKVSAPHRWDRRRFRASPGAASVARGAAEAARGVHVAFLGRCGRTLLGPLRTLRTLRTWPLTKRVVKMVISGDFHEDFNKNGGTNDIDRKYHLVNVDSSLWKITKSKFHR